MTSTGLEPGDFDRRVEILRIRADAIVDANGEIDRTRADTWEVWRRRWARVIPRDGREFWRLEAVDAAITHVIQFLHDRESSAITTDMRVRFQGRIFELTSGINVEEADRIMQFQAVERIA
ncbi:MAG: phage head closure protein [Planctomycetota bacterium]|nr:phage head closure protein [Planctomycetota bacterium]